MKIYVVMDNEEIYGTFSTLEKAKDYVIDLVTLERDRFGDNVIPYYSIYSTLLDDNKIDKGLFSNAEFEWEVYDDEQLTSDDIKRRNEQ